jgi:hypothetical protein
MKVRSIRCLLASFGTCIGSGTDEVQKNKLGKRALGFQSAPLETDGDVPFKDSRRS